MFVVDVPPYDEGACLVLSTNAGVDLAANLDVVVVDVDHFLRVLVFQRVRNRPTHNGGFRIVHGALVVGVMQLGGTDCRNESRRINIVRDLLLHDANVVSLPLVQHRQTAFDGNG